MSEIHPMFSVGYDLGIEHERNRVIELIKEKVESWVREEDWHTLGNEELIALIKGETNA